MSFQTCMTYLLLWNIKNIMKIFNTIIFLIKVKTMLDPTDFYCMKRKSKDQIFIPQKKQSHTGLEQRENKKMMKAFTFFAEVYLNFNCICSF